MPSLAERLTELGLGPTAKNRGKDPISRPQIGMKIPLADRVRTLQQTGHNVKSGTPPLDKTPSFLRTLQLVAKDRLDTFSSIAATGTGVIAELPAPIIGAGVGGISAAISALDGDERTRAGEAFTAGLNTVGEWWYDKVTSNLLNLSTNPDKTQTYYEAVGEGFEWALDTAGKGGVQLGQTFVQPWLERIGVEWTPEIEAQFYAYTKGGVAAALFALPFKKAPARIGQPRAGIAPGRTRAPLAQPEFKDVAGIGKRVEEATYAANLKKRQLSSEKELFTAALKDAASEGVQYAAMEIMWDKAAEGVSRNDYSMVEFAKYNEAQPDPALVKRQRLLEIETELAELPKKRKGKRKKLQAEQKQIEAQPLPIRARALPKPEDVNAEWIPTERTLSDRTDPMPVLSKEWYFKYVFEGREEIAGPATRTAPSVKDPFMMVKPKGKIWYPEKLRDQAQTKLDALEKAITTRGEKGPTKTQRAQREKLSGTVETLTETLAEKAEYSTMTIDSPEFVANYDAYAMRQFEINQRLKRVETAFRDLDNPPTALTPEDAAAQAEMAAAIQQVLENKRVRESQAFRDEVKAAQDRQTAADADQTAWRATPRQRQAMDAGDAAMRGSSIVKHEAGISSVWEKLARVALEKPELLGDPAIREGVVEFLRKHGQEVNYGATLRTLREAMAKMDASRPRQRIESAEPTIRPRPRPKAEGLEPTRPDIEPTGPMGQLRTDITAELNFNNWERLALLQEMLSLETVARHPTQGIIRKQHNVSALGEQVQARLGAEAAIQSEQGAVGASGRFYTPGEAQLLRMLVENIIGVDKLIIPLEELTPSVVRTPFTDVVGLGAKVGVKVGDVPAIAQRYAAMKFGVALDRINAEVGRAAERQRQRGMEPARHPLTDIRTMTEAGFVKKTPRVPRDGYPRDTGTLDTLARRTDADKSASEQWRAKAKTTAEEYARTRSPWGKRLDRFWDKKLGRELAAERKASMKEELTGYGVVTKVRRKQAEYMERVGAVQTEGDGILPVGGVEAAVEAWKGSRKEARFKELLTLRQNRSDLLEQWKQAAADSDYTTFREMLKDASMELLQRFATELGIETTVTPLRKTYPLRRNQLIDKIEAADRKVPQMAWKSRSKIDTPYPTPERMGYTISSDVVFSQMEEAIRTGIMPDEPTLPRGQRQYVAKKDLERQIRSLGTQQDPATVKARNVLLKEMEKTEKIDAFIATREGNYAARQSPEILEQMTREDAIKAAKGKKYKALRLTEKTRSETRKAERGARAELAKELAEAAKARSVLRNRRIAEKRIFSKARNLYLAKRAKAGAKGRYMEDVRRTGEERGVSGPETAALRLERAILAGEQPKGIPEAVLRDFGQEPSVRGLVGRPISRATPRGRQRGAVDTGLVESAYKKLSSIFKKAESTYGRGGPPPGKYARREKGGGEHNWQTAREFIGGAQAQTPLVRKLATLLKVNPKAVELGKLMGLFDILPTWTFTRGMGKMQSYYNMRNKIRGMLVTGTQWKGSLARAFEENGGHWFMGVRQWLPERMAGTRGGLTKEKNAELVRGLLGIGDETPIVRDVRAAMDNAWAYMKKAGVNLPPYVKNYFPYKMKRKLSWDAQNALIDKVIFYSKKAGRRVDPENVASQIRSMAGEDGWMRMPIRLRDPRSYAKEQWNMEKVRKVLDVVPPEEMMQFIETDAAHVLTNYLRDASDRIAYGIKFGANDQKIAAQIKRAEAELNESGMGFSPEDAALLDDLLNITQRTYRMPVSEKWTAIQRFGIGIGNWAKLGMVVPGSMVEALIPLLNRTMARSWAPALATQIFSYPLRGLARQIYRAPPSKQTGFGTLGYDAVVGEVIGKVVSVDQMDLLTANHAADIGGKLSNSAFLVNGLQLMTNVMQSALIRTFRMSMERSMLREAEIRVGKRKRTALHDEDMLMFEYYGVKPDNAMRWLRDGAKMDSAFFIRDYAPALINFIQENVMTARGVNQPKWHSNPNWAFLRHLKTYVTMFGNTVAYGAYKRAVGQTFIESPKHIALRGRNWAQIGGTFAGMYYVAMASEQVMDWWKYGGTDRQPLIERLDGSKEAKANAMAMRAINRWAIGGFPASFMYDLWESGIYSGRGLADEDDIKDLMSGTVGKDGIRALVAAYALFNGMMPGEGEGLTAEEVAALITSQLPMITAMPRTDAAPAADLVPTKEDIQEWITDELQDMGLN